MPLRATAVQGDDEDDEGEEEVPLAADSSTVDSQNA